MRAQRHAKLSKGRLMKSMITAVVLTALATGCATNGNWAWDKSGSTQQSFSADHGQCRAQAFSVPGVTVLQAALVLDGCMHGKGWQKVSRPQANAISIAAMPATPPAPQKKGCDLVKGANGEPNLVCP
jgi:hypothetical protein